MVPNLKADGMPLIPDMTEATSVARVEFKLLRLEVRFEKSVAKRFVSEEDIV
jgi:hypothetical protein